MVGFTVMRTTLLLMLGLIGCAGDIDARWEPVGPAQFAITDCRMSECYRAAGAACPYGYDLIGNSSEVTGATAAPATMFTGPAVRIHRDRTLLVQCKPPVWCDRDPCAYGYHCVVSHAYPGHNVCAI
jgi:hypothetical protein